ncbi:MAG: HupE/UreJ family protein [Acidobacteria bacterium]|nr:HupE/UreJ family protein [Acidobacteriota bacterium]
MNRTLALALVGCLLVVARPAAHEIPNEVTVQTFLKPEGQTLVFLVRAPLKAMRDMDVPTLSNGFLDLSRLGPTLHDAATLWIGDFVEIYENGRLLPKATVVSARVSLPSDKSFASYDEALASLESPALPDDTQLYWQDGLLDVRFEYPIQSDQSRFAIQPGLTRLGLRVNVVLRLLVPGTAERAFDVHGETGIVELDPRWYQAALRFTKDGFFHILDGIDHLLFLLCLVIPFRRLRPLVAVVTAFTVAHSITLIASAFDMAPSALWFPPLIETLIAASIVYMALENITGAHLNRRWAVTFGFGLVHGFGFSFALRESLQFAGSHLVTSLLAFNVGVELGQLIVLLVMLPVLAFAFRWLVDERVGTIILSALVAHTAWHWLVERWDVLSMYPFAWPVVDAAFMASLLRWAMLGVLAVLAAWIVRPLVGGESKPPSPSHPPVR